jgi:DNA-binding MarR family transcriptional regulator
MIHALPRIQDKASAEGLWVESLMSAFIATSPEAEERRALELRLTEAGQAHLDRHGPSFHAFGLMRVPELTEAEHATQLAPLRRYLRLDDERAGRRPRITPPLPQTVTGGRRQ